MKILITFYGETFRKAGGGQCSRERSLDDITIRYQNLATQTHIRLIEYIKNTFNADVTVTLLSYTMEEKYDKQLLEKYNCKKFELVKDINNPPWEKSVHGEINMLKYLSVVFKEERDKHDYNLFIRLDFYIKKYFLKCLKFDNTIKFAFPDTNTNLMKYIDQNDNNMYLDVNHPNFSFLVCHCISQYPKKYYYLLDKYNILGAYHSVFVTLYKSEYFGSPDLSFFVNSMHCSSTNHSWNPLYANIGREESLVYQLENHLGSKVVEINGVWGCGPVTNYYYGDYKIKKDIENKYKKLYIDSGLILSEILPWSINKLQ